MSGYPAPRTKRHERNEQSMTNDPWAAAMAAPSTTAVAGVATVGEMMGGTSAMAQSFAGQPSQLFSTQSTAPSLLNKTHQLREERTGIITKAPYDQQAVDYNTKAPKFWADSQRGQKGAKPVSDPIDKLTGKPNRPVLDTMIEVQTDYAPMQPAERAAIERAADWEDDGKRMLVVRGGAEMKAFRAAMESYNASAEPSKRITSEESMVGLRVRAVRTGQTPNPGGNPSWVVAYRIEQA